MCVVSVCVCVHVCEYCVLCSGMCVYMCGCVHACGCVHGEEEEEDGVEIHHEAEDILPEKVEPQRWD